MAQEFDEIRTKLETISEEIADLAIMHLRDAIDAGNKPVVERRLTRARRAVDKAIHLLSDPTDNNL